MLVKDKIVFLAKKNIFDKIKNNKLLFLLFFLIFIKNLAWLYSFPIWQAPDERSHFGYVQFLAENKRVPKFNKDIYLSKEVGITTKVIDYNEIRFHKKTIQNFKKNEKHGHDEKKLFTKEILKNKKPPTSLTTNELRNLDIRDFSSRGYPPLYYALSTPFYYLFNNSNIINRTEAIRFFSVLISMMILILVYKLSGLVCNDKTFRLAVVAFVGFQPMYSMLSISINPDILSTFFITLLSYLLLKNVVIDNNISTKNNIIIAITLGLFFLTKQYALVGLAMYVFSTAYLAVKNKKFTHYVKKLITSAMIIFPISGWWYLLYMPKLFQAEQIMTFSEYITKHSLKYLGWVFDGYWGIFGWLDTILNLKYYYLLRIITIISLIGFVGILFNSKNKKRLEKYWILIGYLLIFFLFIAYLDSSYVMRGNSGIVQGRYFLLPIVIISILFIKGLGYLIAKKYHTLLFWGIIYFSILFNCICLFNYIIPRYYV